MLLNPYYTAKTEKWKMGFDESGGMRYNKARKTERDEAHEHQSGDLGFGRHAAQHAGRSGGNLPMSGRQINDKVLHASHGKTGSRQNNSANYKLVATEHNRIVFYRISLQEHR